MRRDIEENVEGIAADLPEEAFRACIEGLKRAHGVLALEAEEAARRIQLAFNQEMPLSEERLADFQRLLAQLPAEQEVYPTVRNVACINSREGYQEPRGACRTLFDSDNRTPRALKKP